MEAPTPASALIHSSTLVVAGIFLVIRFSILFEFTVFTNYYMILLGALTLSFGAITATFQNDIKKLVAYSTISQIGYLVCGCGFCCYEEVLIYLIIHALNKAFLFVLVGYTVHFFSGNTDMRQMGGAYAYSFDIAALLFGVCFNLAGLPYSAGFLGKEFLLFQVQQCISGGKNLADAATQLPLLRDILLAPNQLWLLPLSPVVPPTLPEPEPDRVRRATDPP